MSGRVHKSVLNAEVNLIFYFLSFFLAFFSRKIFLDNLGADFIGLTGTLGNILGYLNLAELGIVNCVSFFLFKPLQSNNHQKICEILSLLGYLYNWIGGVIFIGGFIVSLFFPIIFSNAALNLGIIYFAFYSFLGASIIGYYICYRQIILTADQKNYVVATYLQSANLTKNIIQILLAYYYRNPYIWAGIEFLFGFVACHIINWKINREYPWLHTNKAIGKKLIKDYPTIIEKTKQVSIHKIKDFLLVKSDELFIFLFVSLKMVAYYGNYMIIISKLLSLFHAITSSVGASVGNLVAEGNKEKIERVFWEFTTIQHTIAATLCFSLYTLIEPFVHLWLGPEYIMNHNILIVLIIYLYIMNSRNAVDNFNYAYGLYADVWSAWAELIINISITIIGGIKWGIVGILLGKIASLLAIVVLWKPYYLFTSGFKESVFTYWKGVLRNYGISFFSFLFATYIIKYVYINPYHSFWDWILYAIIGMLIFLSIDLSATYVLAKGAKDSLSRIKNIRKK